MFVCVWLLSKLCLQNVDEKILYLNARNPDMEAVAAKYTQPPYNMRIMGDANNYQIAQAMNWMIGNASNEYVLFLEKDFQLVESLDCAMEQLDQGMKMLQVCPRLSETDYHGTSRRRPL